ncbi:MAG: hypothetical protein RL375_1367, partial [Pseudomonadota bacterium]
AGRDVRPHAYWLIVAPASAQRPEVRQLCDWLVAEAAAMRAVTPELA